MFVQHRLELLLQPGRFLHHRLVSAEDFAPLSCYRVRLPDHGRERVQVDASNFDRIDPIGRTVGLTDLPRAMTVEDLHLSSERAQPLRHREGVAARFQGPGRPWHWSGVSPTLPIGLRATRVEVRTTCALQGSLPSRIAPAKLSGCTSKPTTLGLLCSITSCSFLLMLVASLDGRRGRAPTKTSHADIRAAWDLIPTHRHEGFLRQDSLSLQSGTYPHCTTASFMRFRHGCR